MALLMTSIDSLIWWEMVERLAIAKLIYLEFTMIVIVFLKPL